MTEEKILEEVKPFIDACDKMCASKFIMIDKRISDVLKSIATSKLVFQVVKDSMLNFSFENEWKVAVARAGQLNPPDDSDKFIAFVFSLLSAFDNKQLSASDILSRYYSKNDSNLGSYSQFCNDIIDRFKNVVIDKLLKRETKPAKTAYKETASEKAINPDLLSRLEFLLKDLKVYVSGLKKLKKSKITKGELVEIISSLILAVENGQLSYIKAFMLAVKGSYGKDKEIERRLIEINEIVFREI